MGNLICVKTACIVFLLVAAMAATASAQTFTTLGSFGGTNGERPAAPLVQGQDGNLYGTTTEGGDLTCGAPYGCGTVFRISTMGKLTTVYKFCAGSGCFSGTYPYPGLLLATDGSFYGATTFGGPFACHFGNGCGTLFKITPGGELTPLHVFNGNDGAFPYARLMQASDGSFYGAASQGGSKGYGSIFKITEAGGFTILHNFCLEVACDDGAGPTGPLVEATNGEFYGTAYYGGVYDDGTIFTMTPSGTLTSLHNFCIYCKDSDGAAPNAGLVQSADGNLYGTTYLGGSKECLQGCGTVVKITPKGKFSIMYSFCTQSGCPDGDALYGGLVQGTDGNFYGTTQAGGDATCNPPSGCGTLFEITPEGKLTTLHTFGATDGYYPYGTLVQATNGRFYGTTYVGGNYTCDSTYGCGTIFSLDVGLGPFVAFVSNAGKAGNTVGILGQGFRGATSVSLNGMAASFNVISDTFLQATVPDGGTTGYVTVATPSGTLTSNVPFRVVP